MNVDIVALCAAAAGTGVVHTLVGPDHYIPFVAMSRAGGWSLWRTMLVTLLCGVGHVLSSVLLGALGLGAGIALLNLERIESVRGDLAGWLLFAFGLAYTAWGLHRALRDRSHTHRHAHAGGLYHTHAHGHAGEHAHAHGVGGGPGKRATLTPWVLFTIFVFGPCEPLIPLFMYPAAVGNPWHVVLVTAAFSLSTLATMALTVAAIHQGLARGTPGLSRLNLARYGHAIAGMLVLACGVAVTAGL